MHTLQIQPTYGRINALPLVFNRDDYYRGNAHLLCKRDGSETHSKKAVMNQANVEFILGNFLYLTERFLVERECYKCKQNERPNGKFDPKRELRPYGPGGQLVCHECAFATPEDVAITEGSFYAQMEAAEAVGGGVSTLSPDGPIPGHPE